MRKARGLSAPKRPPWIWHQYAQHEEFNAGLDVHAARWLIQTEINTVEVHFIHSRDEIERVLGFTVLYEQDAFEIVFHRDDMSLPLPTADHELLRVLTKNADQVLKERSEEGNEFLDVLAERIIDQLSTGQVNSKKIAGNLGISQRTPSVG